MLFKSVIPQAENVSNLPQRTVIVGIMNISCRYLCLWTVFACCTLLYCSYFTKCINNVRNICFEAPQKPPLFYKFYNDGKASWPIFQLHTFVIRIVLRGAYFEVTAMYCPCSTRNCMINAVLVEALFFQVGTLNIKMWGEWSLVHFNPLCWRLGSHVHR